MQVARLLLTLSTIFEMMKGSKFIKGDDNILIHFSGHGLSYDTWDYFTSFAFDWSDLSGHEVIPFQISAIENSIWSSLSCELRKVPYYNHFGLLSCWQYSACFQWKRYRRHPFYSPNSDQWCRCDALDLMKMFEAAEHCITHADVLTLMSPPICGCQILIPSNGSRPR